MHGIYSPRRGYRDPRECEFEAFWLDLLKARMLDEALQTMSRRNHNEVCFPRRILLKSFPNEGIMNFEGLKEAGRHQVPRVKEL
jgi:hypothetical protein